MLSASRSPIKHSQIILELLDVVLLPQQVAVIHRPRYQKTDDPIALGNKKKQIQPQKRQLNDLISRVLFCGKNLFSHLRENDL
jgi:hypothetical protein